jgi:type I restriction enzyme S subunit
MKLETFFEKFDQFADAPDAVAKMRELVLDLAVKGKLTDRDLKKESVGSKYSDEPSSDVLPANWRLLNFGKFCDIQGGNQPPKSQFSDEPRPGYVRMFQIRDLGERPVPVYISKESTNRFCREGEILIGRYGASVGKVFWAQDGAYNVALAKFIFPEDALLPAFAFWVLKSDFFQAEIAGASRSAQAGFNKGDLAAIDFPLPPLAEQKRIVAKVDELMALCDRLEAQQQERETRHAALARASLSRFTDAPTPANLNYLFHSSFSIHTSDLRKSILTLAVQGKLVPQDPNDEPAEESFPKLAATRVESDDAAFPAHWLRVPLGKMGEWRGGGTPSKSRPEFWKGDLPWISPKDMKVLHIADAQDHISPAAVEGSSVRLIPPGSLLMVVRGMILARAFPVALTTREVTINQDMKALLPSEPKTKDYLLVALRAFEPDVLAAIEHSSHGTCKLKTEFLHDFVLPIPPLAEQRRIVAKVEQLMALVDALETQLAASRATAANLLSALVAELTGTPNNAKVSVPSTSTT